MVIVYKGSPQLNLDDLGGDVTAGAIVGTAAVGALLAAIFWMPYVHAKSIKKDYTVRWYHFFMGPLLWKRQAPADAGAIGSQEAVPDYRIHAPDDSDVPPIMAGRETGELIPPMLKHV